MSKALTPTKPIFGFSWSHQRRLSRQGNKWREARREEPFMPRKSLDRCEYPRRVSSGIARGNVGLNIPPGLPNGECGFKVLGWLVSLD
jgi:hypothetical protein